MIDKIIVFDDLRRYEKPIEIPLVHADTHFSFMEVLSNSKNETIQVILDHDLGGVAFGEETSREGINHMLKMHERGILTVDNAIVVTMNPAGYEWIKSRLEFYHIPYVYDPGGKQIGMTAPAGF